MTVKSSHPLPVYGSPNPTPLLDSRRGNRKEKKYASLKSGYLHHFSTTRVTGNRKETPASCHVSWTPPHPHAHLIHQYCTKVKKDRAFKTLCSCGTFRAIHEPLLIPLVSLRCAVNKPT